jgi:hypothetical protein
LDSGLIQYLFSKPETTALNRDRRLGQFGKVLFRAQKAKGLDALKKLLTVCSSSVRRYSWIFQ